MSETLELDFSHRPPKPSVDEVEAVCAFLQGKGWMKAKVIEAEIGIDDRRVRVIAEKSGGRILSGNDGYRFYDEATPLEEADQSSGRLISQGKKMIRRGMEQRQRGYIPGHRRRALR